MRYPTIHTSLKSLTGRALAGTIGGAALTLILSNAPSAHAQDIDTYGNGLNLQGVYFQGSGTAPNNTQGTPTYGQTITAPANGSSLTSFTFYTENSGSAFSELAEVYSYDAATGTTIGGPLSSSVVTIGTSSNFTEQKVSGLNDILTSGTYVLEFTTVGANLPSSPAVNATFATRYDDEYQGGNFVYNLTNSTATGYDSPGSVPGQSYSNGDDLAFKATFAAAAATPEPGMIVTGLSMLSMTGLGLVRGRRRAKAAAA